LKFLKVTIQISCILKLEYFSAPNTVFFNLGSAEPTGSANSLQGSVRILKLALFLVSIGLGKSSIMFQRFRDLKKVEKHCSNMFVDVVISQD